MLLYHAAILPEVCGAEIEVHDHDLLEFDDDLLKIFSGGVQGGALKLGFIQEALEEIGELYEDFEEEHEHELEDILGNDKVEGKT